MKLLLFLLLFIITILELISNRLLSTINPIEFNLGETVSFNINIQNFFSFDFNPENSDFSTVFLILISGVDSLNLTKFLQQ